MISSRFYYKFRIDSKLPTNLGGGGGGQLKKSQKKSKSISGILGWVLTFFDPKF